MISPGPNKLEKGAVLLLVLWLIVAMSLLGLSFSRSIRVEVTAARNVVDQKVGYYLARAGVEYAVFRILQTQSAFSQTQQRQEQGLDQEIPDVLAGETSIQLLNGSADVEVIEETGKINLNAPLGETYSNMIYNLLIMVGMDPTAADSVTDSIIDWRDQDDFTSPNGAESDYYQGLEESYLAKNGLFDVPDELLLVKGITPEIYYGRKGVTENGERIEYFGLQNYFTTFVRTNTINVNSAPLPVLASLPYLDADMATQIFNLREEMYIQDPSELLARIPGLPTDVAAVLARSTPNNVYTLISTGRPNGSKVVTKIRCVVQVGIGPKGYTTLYWNESNTEI